MSAQVPYTDPVLSGLQKSKRYSTRQIWFALVAGAFGLGVAGVVGEIVLRVAWERPSQPPGMAAGPAVLRRTSEVGYEPAPEAVVNMRGRFPGEESFTERLNSEGFRGGGIQSNKSSSLFRIVAVGDSVVQGLEVPLDATWEAQLEARLSDALHSLGRRAEVINAGVGGYVSWQALKRYTLRCAKFKPDVVLVHVGWNDFAYSLLHNWRPDIHLGLIEDELWGAQTASATRSSLPSIGRRTIEWLYNNSALVGALRSMRNARWNRRRADDLLSARRQTASGAVFNEAALRTYSNNLRELAASITNNGGRIVLLTWPSMLDRASVSDERAQAKQMLRFGQNFPTTFTEFIEWKGRYCDAIRSFAAGHPEVTLIDLDLAFSRISVEDRLELFTDHCHLSRRGNDVVAKLLEAELKPLLPATLAD